MVEVSYVVAATRSEIKREALALSQSTAPVCIDTERAGTHTYDDRACLIQVKRGDGHVVIFDALANPGLLKATLGAAINDQPWIMHAGITDLPCLHALGLFPSTIVDTEVSARLLNHPRTNLKAVTEHCTGLTLEKKYAKVNWARRPLLEDWLQYAALDVAYLEQCAQTLTEELREQGKALFLDQEMTYLARLFSTFVPHKPSWRDIRGAEELRWPLQWQVLHALWKSRDNLARKRNLPPSRLSTDAELLELAKHLPTNVDDVHAILESKRGKNSPQVNMRKAWALTLALRDARSAPRKTWPKKPKTVPRIPERYQWSDIDKLAHDAYKQCAKAIQEVAAELDVDAMLLESGPTLRVLVWETIHTQKFNSEADILGFLRLSELRPWQVEALGQTLVQTLLGFRAEYPR